jgi:antitoxin HicB
MEMAVTSAQRSAERGEQPPVAAPAGLPAGPGGLTEAAIDAEVDRLLALPYRLVVIGEPEEGYLAEAPELPGCFTAGDTPEDAMAMLRDAMAGWFETALRDGQRVPEPSTRWPRGAAETRYSGKFVLRLPRSLHRQLADRAEAEGVSLNQLALTFIAQGLGQPPPAPPATPARPVVGSAAH